MTIVCTQTKQLVLVHPVLYRVLYSLLLYAEFVNKLIGWAMTKRTG
jgi:hypothetical protein